VTRKGEGKLPQPELGVAFRWVALRSDLYMQDAFDEPLSSRTQIPAPAERISENAIEKIVYPEIHAMAVGGCRRIVFVRHTERRSFAAENRSAPEAEHPCHHSRFSLIARALEGGPIKLCSIPRPARTRADSLNEDRNSNSRNRSRVVSNMLPGSSYH
jgi:hypothetical protein